MMSAGIGLPSSRLFVPSGGAPTPYPLTVSEFDAVAQQYFSISNGSQSGLGITGSLSLAAWIKPTLSTSQQMLISKWGSSPNRSYVLNTSSTTKLRFVVSSTGSNEVKAWSSSNVLVANVWQHIGAVYNQASGYLRLYLNGSQTGSDTSHSEGVHDGDRDFLIGRHRTDESQDLFDGQMCLAGVWNRALSDTEISALYHSGDPLWYDEMDTIDPALKSNLVSWWNLADNTDNHASNDLANHNGVSTGSWTWAT